MVGGEGGVSYKLTSIFQSHEPNKYRNEDTANFQPQALVLSRGRRGLSHKRRGLSHITTLEVLGVVTIGYCR